MCGYSFAHLGQKTPTEGATVASASWAFTLKRCPFGQQRSNVTVPFEKWPVSSRSYRVSRRLTVHTSGSGTPFSRQGQNESYGRNGLGKQKPMAIVTKAK